MGLPRSSYVKDNEIGVYHCFTRCVRRAFLSGLDSLTGRDFSHRKSWIVDRLRFLASIFAIDVCAYAVMDNHYHTILRTRPDLVASWSDLQVATRWLTLFPRYCRNNDLAQPLTQSQISDLASRPARIAQLRTRLSSLSWFVGRLNEYIARAANEEDHLKGRFWESRFKSLDLLDEAAIAACMVYVDLNPIRAGLAACPELSDFTSIQQRIRDWYSKMSSAESLPSSNVQNPTQPADNSKSMPASFPVDTTSWLCPILSNSTRLGILHMSEAEYFDLVDKSGPVLHSAKHAAIDPELVSILLRLSINPDSWLDTVSRFDSRFHLAAGLLSSLQSFAHHLGKRWIAGVTAAKTAFSDSLPLSA